MPNIILSGDDGGDFNCGAWSNRSVVRSAIYVYELPRKLTRKCVMLGCFCSFPRHSIAFSSNFLSHLWVKCFKYWIIRCWLIWKEMTWFRRDKRWYMSMIFYDLFQAHRAYFPWALIYFSCLLRTRRECVDILLWKIFLNSENLNRFLGHLHLYWHSSLLAF